MKDPIPYALGLRSHYRMEKTNCPHDFEQPTDNFEQPSITIAFSRTVS
jgi:hypothetical protein